MVFKRVFVRLRVLRCGEPEPFARTVLRGWPGVSMRGLGGCSAPVDLGTAGLPRGPGGPATGRAPVSGRSCLPDAWSDGRGGQGDHPRASEATGLSGATPFRRAPWRRAIGRRLPSPPSCRAAKRESDRPVGRHSCDQSAGPRLPHRRCTQTPRYMQCTEHTLQRRPSERGGVSLAACGASWRPRCGRSASPHAARTCRRRSTSRLGSRWGGARTEVKVPSFLGRSGVHEGNERGL